MKYLKLSIMFLLAAMVSSHAQVSNISDLGRPVAEELANEWIENRKNSFNDQPVYFFDRGSINKMLTPAVGGVYFFNATENDNETLVVKPVSANGYMIDNGVGYLAKTSWGANFNDLSIPDRRASEMVERFQKQCQNCFMAHAYGRKVFDELLSQHGAEGISVMKGLDSNGEEHLILQAVDKNGQPLEYATIWNHGSGIFFLLYMQEKLGLASR